MWQKNNRKKKVLPPSAPWFLGAGWRILGVLLATFLIPTVLFVLLLATQAPLALKAQAIEQNRVAAELASKAVQKHFEGLANYLESFVRRESLLRAMHDKNQSPLRAHLRDLVTKNLEFSRAFITDSDGMLLADYPVDPEWRKENLSRRDWYQGVSAARQTYVSEIFQPQNEPRRFNIAIATPIRIGEYNLLGFLVGQHPIENLSAWLAEVRPPFAGKVFLIDHHGNVVSRIGLGEPPPLNVSRDPLIQKVLSERGREEGSLVAADPVTGERSLISFVKVRPMDWSLVSVQSVDAALAPLKHLGPPFFIFTLTFLAGLFLLYAWILHTIRRHHFSQLEAERALLLSEQQFQAIVESVADYAIAGLNREGFIQTWNPGAEKIKGYSAEEILGQHFSIFYPEHERILGLPREILEGATRDGRSSRTGWFLRKDGSRFWAEVVVSVVYDPMGNLRGFSLVTRDLTSEKHTEETLLQKNAELEALMRELVERTKRLQRFHNLTVDRELDMKGLKQEVNSLLEKLGESKRY